MNARDKANAGRVHITYDVETGGAIRKPELPFVVGVIGDFAGDPKDADGRSRQPPLAERRFVDIDRKNFDKVMGAISPILRLEVDNVLGAGAPGHDAADAGTTLRTTLVFKAMEDFHPARIAEQVPELKALTEIRSRLRELHTKANRSEDLREMLKKILDEGLGGTPRPDNRPG